MLDVSSNKKTIIGLLLLSVISILIWFIPEMIGFDANVSLRLIGAEKLGTRSETKNVNSLRSVERAVTGEIIRQSSRLEQGERIIQETRHFLEESGQTRPGRSKEQAEDYRYE